MSVAFSHDSKLLASASSDNTVKVWDAATGSLQQTLGHSNWVNSVAFSHDSKLLASASYNMTVKVWEAATGTLQQTIVFDSYISTLSFDITNSTLITNIGRIKVDRNRIPSVPVSSQGVGGKCDREGLGISGSWVI
jgi:WD40 repeat protein